MANVASTGGGIPSTGGVANTELGAFNAWLNTLYGTFAPSAASSLITQNAGIYQKWVKAGRPSSGSVDHIDLNNPSTWTASPDTYGGAATGDGTNAGWVARNNADEVYGSPDNSVTNEVVVDSAGNAVPNPESAKDTYGGTGTGDGTNVIPAGASLPATPTIPNFPSTPPPNGYHWELQEGLEGYNWIPIAGTLNWQEQQSLAQAEINKAEFEYKKAYDAQQLALQHEQMAANQANADRDFQLALEQVYAQLAQSPQNWIVASEFLNKIKPGEATQLTTPKWLSPLTGVTPGSPLTDNREGKGGYIAPAMPSAQMYGQMTPTQQAMLEGLWGKVGGAPGDIKASILKTLPNQGEKTARWKPSIQV
jgi:hypothetical protein